MTGSAKPRSALRQIPGWESANWRALDGGITNRNWLVDAGGRKAVLKIDDEPRSTPFTARRVEARVQEAAAAEGIANRVLFASDTIYLTEYEDGTVWSAEHLEADENLLRLAALLQRVHALPPVGHGFDAAGAAQHYMQAVATSDRDKAEQCSATIRSIGQASHLRCCHNDLVAENVLDADGLRLLDWEYCADNDPLFDLATVVAHHGLSGRQADLLLDAYFDGDAARWREPFSEQVRLYVALHWLWNASRQASKRL